MNENNLFKDAIAEAKTVRDIAIQNARNTLAESFTPKIKSMFATKLQETEDEANLDEYKDEHEITDETALETDTLGGDDEELDLELIDSVSENESSDEVDLDELLAEMEAEEGDETELDEEVDLEEILSESDDEDTDLDEAKSKDKDADKADKPKDKDKSKSKSKEDKEKDEEEKVEDMSVDELKALIKDVVTQMQDGTDETSEDFEDFEVDSTETKNEFPVSTEPAAGQLQEAIKTIKFLRKNLNEVNLLNAKLLYVNKLFKSKNLNESQKLKVINAFDKATNVKEVKNTFNILSETLKTSSFKRKPIKESLGFASKSTGSKLLKEETTIVPSAFVLRMQQIAGIKPLY